jgi:hypothetical protein
MILAETRLIRKFEFSRYQGNWTQYRRDCVNAIRDLVLALIKHGGHHQAGRPVGICLRALNDNDHTEQLLADLNLPPHLIEVVRFFGTGGQGQTVKQVIAQRQKPHLPYLFMVTSKARMGDQFPSDVRYFIELSQTSSDLNALLQGLVGRSCGYGKNSLVILSDRNRGILDAYVSTHGDYVMQPSRHSIVGERGDRLWQTRAVVGHTRSNTSCRSLGQIFPQTLHQQAFPLSFSRELNHQ